MSDLENGFDLDGFLSENLDRHKHELVSDNAEWFEFADRVNRFALRLWGREVDNLQNKSVISHEALNARLMSRAIGALEASILLLKVGMSVEPLNVSRSIYESVFWMGAFNRDFDKYYNIFEVDAKRSQLSREELILDNNWKDLADDDLNIESLRSDISKKPRPNLKEIAQDNGTIKLYLKYKLICDGASHASLRSTSSYIKVIGSDCFHEFGPNTVNVNKVFPLILEPIFYALKYYAISSSNTHLIGEIELLENEFFELVGRL